MTAMNAMVEPNAITLSMDTLASRRDKNGDVVPYYFSQKFEYYPFARSILCGTGSFSVIQKAMAFAKKILAKEVNTFTQIISDFLIDNPFNPNDETSTVYIFGFDEILRPHAFALRSTNNYKIEEIANYNHPNWFVKPASKAALDYLDQINSMDTMNLLKNLMRKEKEIDDASSSKEKVGIGGENIVISLMPINDNLIAAINIIDTFDDYDQQYQYCLDHINDN